MSKTPRKPPKTKPPPAIDPAQRLAQSATALRQAAKALAQDSALFDQERKNKRLYEPATSAKVLRALLIDDSPELPKVVERLSQRLNGRLQFEYCNPSTAQDALTAIRNAIRSKPPINLLLIDHQLLGDLTGEDILKALNALHQPEDLPLRYLPRAAITENADETQTLAEVMLALGADAIYFEKAHTHERNNSSAIVDEDEQRNPILRFLTSLLDTEYKEMRARAWGRVWRDTRNRVEEQIIRQREQPCTSFAQLQLLISACWQVVSESLVNSEYVTKASFRVFHEGELYSIKPTTQELSNHDLEVIKWDDFPCVKRWLKQACDDAPKDQTSDWQNYYIPELKATDILSEERRGNQKYEELLHTLKGYAAMGMPLITQHGPIGLFVLVRQANMPAFGQTDWDQMRTLGLRMASYLQNLLSRVREHDRRQGMMRLHQKLQTAGREVDLLKCALEHVHEVIFSSALGLHGKPQMPPPTGVDAEGRSTVRWLSHNGEYPGCGLGKGINNPWLVPLHDDKKLLIRKVIECGKSIFYRDTKDDALEYNPPAHGLNRSLIHAPIKQAGLCIAVLSIGHTTPGYFGASKDHSADFRYLEQIAEMVGYVIESKRAARFQNGLIQAMLGIGKQESDVVLDKLVNVLHGYTRGCNVMLWVKPQGMCESQQHNALDMWQVSHCWHAQPQNSLEDQQFEGCLVRQGTEIVQEWNGSLNKHWSNTQIAKSVFADNEPLDYVEEGFVSEKDKITRAQANLRIARGTEPPQALLVMLFVVPNALNLSQQRETFSLFAHFCARYLIDQSDWDKAARRAQLADDQRLLADSYHAMRHGLRNQLWHINESLGQYLGKYPRQSSAQKLLHNDISRYILSAGDDIEISALLSKAPLNKAVKLNDLLKRLTHSFEARAKYLHVTLDIHQVDELIVLGDVEHLRIIMNTLVGNALDEFDRLRMQQPRSISVVYRTDWLPSADGIPVAALCFDDTGPGVNPSVADRMFQRDNTNKSSGTGFSLYFAFGLAQRIGWKLLHDQNYISGARFVLIPPSSVQTKALERGSS